MKYFKLLKHLVQRAIKNNGKPVEIWDYDDIVVNGKKYFMQRDWGNKIINWRFIRCRILEINEMKGGECLNKGVKLCYHLIAFGLALTGIGIPFSALIWVGLALEENQCKEIELLEKIVGVEENEWWIKKRNSRIN